MNYVSQSYSGLVHVIDTQIILEYAILLWCMNVLEKAIVGYQR